MSLAGERAVNWNPLISIASRREAYESQLKAGDYANARGAKVYALVPAGPTLLVFNFITGFMLEGIPGWSAVMMLPHAEKRRAHAASWPKMIQPHFINVQIMDVSIAGFRQIRYYLTGPAALRRGAITKTQRA